MTRRKSGPNVEWVGLIIKTNDGNMHAVELLTHPSNFITADLIINRTPHGIDELDVTAVIRGRGRYWTEGEDIANTMNRPKRELPTRSYRTIESAGEAL